MWLPRSWAQRQRAKDADAYSALTAATEQARVARLGGIPAVEVCVHGREVTIARLSGLSVDQAVAILELARAKGL